MNMGKENNSETNDILVQFFDQIIAYFIYGLIAKMLAFSVSSIWLSYISLSFLQLIFVTHVFSLYLIKRIPETNSKPKEQSSLEQIFQEIRFAILNLPSMFISKENKKAFNALTALSYLLTLLCIYNIPAILGIMAIYTILCLSHGPHQTKSLLNLNMLVYSSLFAILFQSSHPLALISMGVLSMAILVEAYIPDETNTGISQANKLYENICSSFAKLHQGIRSEYNTIHILFLLVILSPIFNLFPILCILNSLIFSPSGIVFQTCLSTVMLGEKLYEFLLPNMAETSQKFSVDSALLAKGSTTVAANIQSHLTAFFSPQEKPD